MNSDSAPTVINAVMDISVCKEVLTHLIPDVKALDLRQRSNRLLRNQSSAVRSNIVRLLYR
jgi:hypothetical protein